MNNEKLLYGVVGAVIGGLLVWVLTVQSFTSGNTGMMRMMGYRSTSQMPMTNASTIDQHFIEQMIPHHEDAITMAKLAQTKAKTPEVKQLAENIIRTQSAEITKMKVWYKEWFGRELPTGSAVMQHHGMMSGSSMHMGMMGDNTDFTRLETAADFDREFVEEMIPHHQMAVMMASMLQNGTTRPEMKQLADDIITAQTAEIDQMRGWLTEWNNER